MKLESNPGSVDDALKDLQASPGLDYSGGRVPESFGNLLPAPKPEPANKPGSATVCHIIAVIGAGGGGIFLLVALVSGAKAEHVYPALGVLFSSVFWWALGDIVVGTNGK